MVYPDIEEVKKLSANCNVIPVMTELYADMETPISVYKRFEDCGHSFLLESVEGGRKWARYSFIGKNPFMTVESRDKKTVVKFENGQSQIIDGNPVTVIKNLMEKYKGADVPGMPRFNGGAVGFFGYDLVRYYENLPDMPNDDMELPDCHFMFSDEVIVFDHLKQKIKIIVNIHVNGNVERSYNSAVARLKEMTEEISSTSWKINKTAAQFSPSDSQISENTSRDEYCGNVAKAKEYIKNGDIFQVVLSQRICVETQRKPLDVYRALRAINPSPYMYCLKFEDYSVVGSSPEMLCRVENGMIETCPIAGTRQRGATKKEDLNLENELLDDAKEIAEHTMLVDLSRNDVGKVSEYGSVEMLKPMHIEKYSHVMHIVTNVKGKLKKGLTSFDALMSVLPAGTLSGAPKIRAMEIIDELEKCKRGIYGGAIGYLSFDGNLDSCITIRTMVFKNGKAYVQAGAGIVADSQPEKEYAETMNKARALLNALEEAGEIA